MHPPEVYGVENADITFIGWGSTYGSLRETVDRLNENGTRANLFHFVDLWPMSEEKILPLLQATKYTVCVEGNYTGQFAGLLRRETGFKVNKLITRYDGRPFTVDYILDALREEVKLHV